MSLQEKFEKLQSDFSNLDPDNIGNWPIFVKAVCWVLAAVAVVLLGYQLVLREQVSNLDVEKQKELSLRSEFEKKVQDAANLDAYRAQNQEMQDRFNALLQQLPKDTEVPGLLDDISDKGNQSGLNFEAIDLQPEKKSDFYIELPISIKVKGGYHDFGAFVSGIAGMPRIVTLHDFIMIPAVAEKAAGKADGKSQPAVGAGNSEELSMTILAKTYRYKSAEEAEKDAETVKKDPKKTAKDGKNSKGGAKK